MEGSLSAALGELDKLDRRASWHFSNPKGGPLLQHYETEAITWHAGYEANCAYVGIEHEGKAGEPLTEVQLANDIALLRWLSQAEAWPSFTRHVTLWEHNEFMATSCPSGRIPWDRLIAALEAPMPKILSPEEALKFNAQVAFHLNDNRDLGKIATVIQYVYRVKGWPWPAA
jgi:N-acetyl-anhydromuramyl-L-alanine amidase AmpD